MAQSTQGSPPVRTHHPRTANPVEVIPTLFLDSEGFVSTSCHDSIPGSPATGMSPDPHQGQDFDDTSGGSSELRLRPQTDRPGQSVRLGWPEQAVASVLPLARRALKNKRKKACLLDNTRLHLPETIALQLSRRAPYMRIHIHDIMSSRTSSPVPSTPQSLTSHPPPTPVDDGPEAAPATPDATPDETDFPQCEFDIDWENIWHCGKRALGAKKRHRHKRAVDTKIKESWIYRHGANLDHNGVRYWLCRLCHEKKSYSALYASPGTSHAARHLLRRHQIAEFRDSGPSLKNPFTSASSSDSSSSRPLSRQTGLGFQLASHFNEGHGKLVFWTASSSKMSSSDKHLANVFGG